MSNDLTSALASRIAAGVDRRTLRLCSIWATRYRIMSVPYPGNFSFKHFPWLREIHDDDSETLVAQKAAQMGLSEFAINKVFFRQDIFKESALYLLPNSKPDAADFSVGRFEPALQLSQHLNDLYSDTKNVGMKKAGNAILYIRGSRSESQLKSIPTGLIVFDEYDEMPDTTLALAKERASGQLNKQFILISTPTIPNHGISSVFITSDQKHFFFRCPRCGQMEELVFDSDPDKSSLVITAEVHTDAAVNNSYLRCLKTNKELPHSDKSVWLESGKWVKSRFDTDVSGYHINQMYSSTMPPGGFARAFLEARTNPFAAQEFAKSKLGIPYVEDGAQVTLEEIASVTKRYESLNAGTGKLTTLGVDVGTRLHFEVTEYTFSAGVDVNLMANAKVLKAGSVTHFEELDTLMRIYGVSQCVIDANPETRKAREFAGRFPGRVKLCYYITGLSSANPIVVNADLHTVKVDRTSWLDMSMSRFRNNTIILPSDISHEYSPHMRALVRRYEKDRSGNVVARYVSKGADHLGHARNYNEIALNIAANVGDTHNIGNVL